MWAASKNALLMEINTRLFEESFCSHIRDSKILCYLVFFYSELKANYFGDSREAAQVLIHRNF